MLITLSLYVFDDLFYNNSNILNRDITPGGVTYGTANNRHVKHIRKVHEEVINSTKIDSTFKPLKILDPARPLRTLLPKDCKIRNLTSFVKLVFREEQYELLTRNTNKYAAAYPELYPNKKVVP